MRIQIMFRLSAFTPAFRLQIISSTRRTRSEGSKFMFHNNNIQSVIFIVLLQTKCSFLLNRVLELIKYLLHFLLKLSNCRTCLGEHLLCLFLLRNIFEPRYSIATFTLQMLVLLVEMLENIGLGHRSTSAINILSRML